MRLFTVDLVGRSVGDMGVGNDEGGPVEYAEGFLDRPGDGRAVVSVDLDRVPPERLELAGDILRERQVGSALDADLVVVVEIDQAAQPEVTGQ